MAFMMVAIDEKNRDVIVRECDFFAFDQEGRKVRGASGHITWEQVIGPDESVSVQFFQNGQRVFAYGICAQQKP